MRKIVMFVVAVSFVAMANHAQGDAWWGKGARQKSWVVAHGGSLIYFSTKKDQRLKDEDMIIYLYHSNGKYQEKEKGYTGMFDDAEADKKYYLEAHRGKKVVKSKKFGVGAGSKNYAVVDFDKGKISLDLGKATYKDEEEEEKEKKEEEKKKLSKAVPAAPTSVSPKSLPAAVPTARPVAQKEAVAPAAATVPVTWEAGLQARKGSNGLSEQASYEGKAVVQKVNQLENDQVAQGSETVSIKDDSKSNDKGADATKFVKSLFNWHHLWEFDGV